MSETLREILTYIGGTVGIATIVTTIVCIGLKVIGAKIEARVKENTSAKVFEEVLHKMLDQIKNVSFKQSIEPIAKSELEKVNEKSIAFIEKALAETNRNYEKLLKVLESLAKYFDNSIGVSEEAKAELRQALKEAEIEPTIDNVVEVEQIIVEEEKEPKKAKSSVKVAR